MTINATGNDDVRTPYLGVVSLYGKVTFTTAGAIGSQTAAGKSGFTMSKTGTGIYLVTFSRKWDSLLHWTYTNFNATVARGDTWEERVVLATNDAIQLTCVNASGAAANATTTNVLSLCFDIRGNGNGG